MRLIDADAIFKNSEFTDSIIVKNLVPYINLEHLVNFIDNLPTAYDVDKVVEQLQKLFSENPYAAKGAAEIVRNGVKE